MAPAAPLDSPREGRILLPCTTREGIAAMTDKKDVLKQAQVVFKAATDLRKACEDLAKLKPEDKSDQKIVETMLDQARLFHLQAKTFAQKQGG